MVKRILEGKVLSMNLTGSVHNTGRKEMPCVALSIQDDSGKENPIEIYMDLENDTESARKELIGQTVVYKEESESKGDWNSLTVSVTKKMKVRSGQLKGIAYRNRETYIPAI